MRQGSQQARTSFHRRVLFWVSHKDHARAGSSGSLQHTDRIGVRHHTGFINNHNGVPVPAQLHRCMLRYQIVCANKSTRNRHGFISHILTDHHIRRLAGGS